MSTTSLETEMNDAPFEVVDACYHSFDIAGVVDDAELGLVNVCEKCTHVEKVNSEMLQELVAQQVAKECGHLEQEVAKKEELLLKLEEFGSLHSFNL